MGDARAATMVKAAGRVGTMRRRRDAALAWLGVVALLINALLPVGLSGAPSGSGHGVAAGFCGHAPEPAPPGLPLPCGRHCLLCCAMPSGAAPVDGVRIACPGLIGRIALVAAPTMPAPHPFPYGSPPPRGPPALA